MLTENIDWLQMQVEQKQFNLSASDNFVHEEAYNKIFKVFNFQKNNLVNCWSGSSSQYIDEIDKLLKVQRQLYDQLMSGASA